MLLLTNVEGAIAQQVADEASMRFEARTSAHDPRHARKLSMPSTHYTHRIRAIRCVVCVVASDERWKLEEAWGSHGELWINMCVLVVVIPRAHHMTIYIVNQDRGYCFCRDRSARERFWVGTLGGCEEMPCPRAAGRPAPPAQASLTRRRKRRRRASPHTANHGRRTFMPSTGAAHTRCPIAGGQGCCAS